MFILYVDKRASVSGRATEPFCISLCTSVYMTVAVAVIFVTGVFRLRRHFVSVVVLRAYLLLLRVACMIGLSCNT